MSVFCIKNSRSLTVKCELSLVPCPMYLSSDPLSGCRLSMLIPPRRPLQPINLRRQNKVALRQPIDLVRPDGNPDLPPGQQDIGMVSLVLREFPYLIHEPQCGLEVRKRKLPFEMMIVHDLPVLHLGFQRPDLCSSQRRYSTSARDARLFCES